LGLSVYWSLATLIIGIVVSAFKRNEFIIRSSFALDLIFVFIIVAIV